MRCWQTALSPRGTDGGRPAANWSYPATMRSTLTAPTLTWRSASRQPTPSAALPRIVVIHARLRSWGEAASRQACFGSFAPVHESGPGTPAAIDLTFLMVGFLGQG